jgi:hypothetical protein
MEVVINAAGLAAEPKEPKEPEGIVDEIGVQAGLSDRMSTLVMGEEGTSEFIGEADDPCRPACVNACQEHHRHSLSFLRAAYNGPRPRLEATTRTDYSKQLQRDTDLGRTSLRIYGGRGRMRSRHRFPPRTWPMNMSTVN